MARKEKNRKLVKPVVEGVFENTAGIPVPGKLVDQVVGQEKAVEIIKKAAAQKRNVLLVGLPGTGKSLIAQAMAEILPVSELQDVLVYPNHQDPNTPRIRKVVAGEGKKIVEKGKLEARAQEDNLRLVSLVFPMAWLLISFVFWKLGWIPDVVYAATLIVGVLLFIGFALGSQVRTKSTASVPKLLIDNNSKKIAPFIDATGARAGALLGDVRHDPLQCFVNVNQLIVASADGSKELISFEALWGRITGKHPELIEKHENGYEAIVFPKEENAYTYGFKDGQVVLSRIYSMNRKPHNGKIVDINLNGKTLSVTPEHKIVTKSKSKQAEKISQMDKLIFLSTEKELVPAVA
ncbi:MAG: ATP-binding protein [Candidatus Diapherotrites archaeon]|nr:ATP-binding protein [Candidatus Diapherotrites archaeon]